jgi:SAM-dependent methyltransferase
VTVAPADPGRFVVRGWIASAESIGRVRFFDEEAGRLLPLSSTERPDVERAFGLPARGFEATCRYDDVRDREFLTLCFGEERGEMQIVVPVQRPSTDRQALRHAKLERIRPLLQCPNCGSQSFKEGADELECRSCASRFPRSPARFDFLTPQLRSAFDIVSTENVSANVYDGEALNLVHRHREGLILDCGAGLRERYYGNVVNYEIVPYDSTDVLGVGEKLPFRDAAFDAVFSFAVLEHVKDPFACARELLRVLKPGGTLYAQVPFLQPVHGYPHHYHNMTLAGLEGLFGSSVRIERSGPSLFGQPVFALSWFLNRYVEGLPEPQREAFNAMRVEELLRPASESLGAPFVTALAAASREELSCCNSLIATKVPAP